MATVISSATPTKPGVLVRATEGETGATKGKRTKGGLSPAARREERTGWLFMLPFVLLFLLVFIVPILYAVYSSFFQQVATGGGAYGGGEIVNRFVGLENFKYVITSGTFWAGMGRVLLYTLIQVPIMIISALALAMLLDSLIVKHVAGFRLGYFLPYAIPGVIASIIWVYLYNGQISPIVKGLAALGINVDFFASNVVLASMVNITTWTFTGYNMLIFLSALQAIPHELYEAARIDGCTRVKMIWYMTLPSILPTIVTMFLLGCGNIMRIGPDKALLLYNSMTYEVADIFSTYVYRIGLVKKNFSFATAVGLFESVIAVIVLLAANTASRRITGESLW